jgi:2,3-bisphosphoglycerate-dependent phosphoglycerate mutase
MKKRQETHHIYLFRHGQTTFNRDNKFTGFTDALLTETGKEDAKIIALRLKKRKFQIAFQTSLSRSQDTLKIVLKDHPECNKIIIDDRMLERDYGNLNKHTHLEIVEKYGPEKYDSWHRAFSTRPPGGESFADVEKRVRPFIKDLIKLIKKQKVNVVISAHGNSIRLFRKIMEKLSEKETSKLFIPYEEVFEYKIKV